MCLAVPGLLLDIVDASPLTRRGRVSFDGLIKEVNLSFVPEAEIGSYVLTHVGIAISIIDKESAQKTLEYLQALGELDDETKEHQ